MHLKMTRQEQADFDAILRGYADDPRALQMKQYIQHGHITTYRHCMRVAKISFLLNRRLRLGAEETSLVRGAFLHDFYLYDWHDCSRTTHWHGFTHPAAALRNARRYFALNATEQDIIQNHMWPLTLRHIPHSRAAAIECLADKISSSYETVLERRAVREKGK